MVECVWKDMFLNEMAKMVSKMKTLVTILIYKPEPN